MTRFTYDSSRLARLSAKADSARLAALAANDSFLELRNVVAAARRACQMHQFDADTAKVLRGDRETLLALMRESPDLNDIGIRPAQLRELVGLLEQLDYAAADAARTYERSKQQSELVARLEAFIQ
ncbi:hypothetical protein EJO68_04170 [Variovorax atrisoli]|uniref:hypothetical protein n=1 Tax=Variovorax atrisoli TaxID=3394203 RepID=UPI000F7E4A02|nr:hypothetical protein [Variovorax sp. 369]RTD98575.1 hypothetical protein EJO68_04170 [Variovorax sp. 369]